MFLIYLILDPLALLHDRNVVQVNSYNCLNISFVKIYTLYSADLMAYFLFS